VVKSNHVISAAERAKMAAAHESSLEKIEEEDNMVKEPVSDTATEETKGE
jgi:hypothetical protein